MKVEGVNLNNVINIYKKVKNVEGKKVNNVSNDSVQISSIGKSLSNYSIETDLFKSDEKINALRNQISQGTYNKSSELTAKKMIDIIKGRSV